MLATKENLKAHWLGGSTCRHHKLTMHWESPCGNYILMKHHGHAEYIGRFSGTAWCATHYTLFDTREEKPPMFDKQLFKKEGRLSQDAIAEIKAIIKERGSES